MTIDITIGIGKVSCCQAPGARVRLANRDISWNGRPREVPDTDASTAELHGSNTSTIGIEARPESIFASIDSTARSVPSAVGAVCGEGLARLFPLDVHGASR